MQDVGVLMSWAESFLLWPNKDSTDALKKPNLA